MEQIISLAAYAPSWKNTQISRYIAIEDPKVLEEICRTYAPFNARIIGNCPLLIAQTFVKGRSGFERDGSFSTDREAGWQYYDCGIACQTLCLAAHDLGLGTVVMGVFDRKGLEAYLQIPEDQELMALIALPPSQLSMNKMEKRTCMCDRSSLSLFSGALNSGTCPKSAAGTKTG